MADVTEADPAEPEFVPAEPESGPAEGDAVLVVEEGTPPAPGAASPRARRGDEQAAAGGRPARPGVRGPVAGSAADPRPIESIDPRTVRVRVADGSRLGDEDDVILGPADVDSVRLESLGGDRFRLMTDEGVPTADRIIVVVGTPARDGSTPVEVVVDGWRIELSIVSERRTALREHASRGRGAAVRGGPVDVRAIIPGRVLAVAVAPGDDVAAGGQLLTVEAMKMQNEVRAPRAGRVVRVLVGAGQTIDVGDVLVVLE